MHAFGTCKETSRCARTEECGRTDQIGPDRSSFFCPPPNDNRVSVTLECSCAEDGAEGIVSLSQVESKAFPPGFCPDSIILISNICR